MRTETYGVKCDIKALNAADLDYAPGSFDTIIFFACLEHMTMPERLSSLCWAWDSLMADGLMVIVETPNRLWYFDGHTSKLPFFNWLPHDLAFDYAKFSEREVFKDLYGTRTAETELHFLRRGRGVSFHEIDVAIGPHCKQHVVSSLASHRGMLYRLRNPRLDRQYKALMRRIYPNVHEGFFDPALDLIIRKP